MKLMKNEKKRVIETYCKSPTITMKDLSRQTDIPYPTLMSWMHDSLFVDQIYKRYMEIAGIELPNVIGAMIREAKTGNVQAGRLVLEHFGKLENKIKIQVESPFEKFVKAKEVHAEDGEYIDADDKDFLNNIYSDNIDAISTLPERNVESQNQREIKEKKEVKYITQKEIRKVNQSSSSQSRYKIRKRANAVGLEMMTTSGRPMKSERDEWMTKLRRREVSKFGKTQDL